MIMITGSGDHLRPVRPITITGMRTRPALHLRKLRDLELKAGHKPARGPKGTAHSYNLKSVVKVEAGPGIPAVAVDCQSAK